MVLSAVRSAIGSFGGGLSNLEPHELAGTVMKEAEAGQLRDGRQLHPD